MPTEQRRARTGPLHGGISQQPDHVRHPNQVTEATNVVASVVDGLRRRTGTRYVKGISDLTADGDYRLHPIDRDENEKYLAVYGEGVIRVFDRFGNEGTVTITSDAATYLDSNSPTADQLRPRTILDSTFWINTTVPVDTDDTVVSYTVTANHTDYDVLASQLPSADGEYHRALADGDVRPEGYYQYDVDGENGFAYWTRDSGGSVHNALWDQALGLWTDASINPLGFKVRFQREAITITNANYDPVDATYSNKVTIGDAGTQFSGYEWQAGDEIYVSNGGGTDLPDGYYPILSKLDDSHIEIDRDGVSDVVGSLQTETAVQGHATNTVSNAIDCSAITRAYNAVHNFSSSPKNTMEEVALALQDAIRTEAGSDPGGSDIIIQYLETGRFRIVSPWRGTGSKVLALYQPDSGTSGTTHLADQSSDPFWFASGTATDGTGSPSESTQFVDSRWVQVSAPGSATSTLDTETMPVQMTRTSTSPLSFTIDVVSWNARLSGDDDSNPLPELFSESAQLADMTLWNDRLWLFGDTYVAASQAGDIFNFYRADATTAADDDPIDLRLSNDRVTKVDYVAQFREAIEVFTKAGQQYRSNSPDSVTPTSIAFTPSTTYNTLSVRPFPVNQRLYFLGSGNEGGKCYESFYDDLTVSNEAAEITRHVPSLLPDSMRTIIAHANENTVFALPVDDNDLYVYTSHWQGDSKVQSAWCKWEYDSDYRIADIALLNDDCYMLVDSGSRDADRYVIEKFKVSGGGEDSFTVLSESANTINIGVFDSPKVVTAWKWSDGSETDDIRAYLEGLFTINWIELPDPITASSLSSVDVLLLTANASTTTANGIAALSSTEQGVIRDFIRAGGNYIAVLENPEATPSSPAITDAIDSLMLGDLTGDDDLDFTFDGDAGAPNATGTATTFDSNLPVIDNDAGTVSSIDWDNPASIQTTDSRATSTGSIPATSDLDAGQLLSYFARGAYGTTAGAILIIGDSQMFWDSSGLGNASSEALLGNFMYANANPSSISEGATTTLTNAAILDRTFVVTGSLNGSDTEFTSPIHDPDVDTVILGPDFGANEGNEVAISSISSSTITVEDQDLTDGEVIIGRQFTSTIKPTDPFIRDGNGFAIRNVWLQHREVITEHHNTTGYTVKAEMPQRSDRTRTFDTSTPETGENVANLNGNVANTTLTINSVGAEPMTIVGIEYDMDFVPRDG